VLKDLQRALAAAFTSPDPAAALRREVASLAPEDRALLERANPDGVALTGLLVRKLRFERICRGDDDAAAWFDRDPRGFTEAFKAYDAEVPPTRFFPQSEARDFRDWLRKRGFREPGAAGDVKEA
jgi:hypothetical protein